MHQPSALFTLLLLAGPGTLYATPVLYNVTVDTSSVSGVSGSLDFNFNPGPFATQLASLQILDFGGNGTVDTPASLTGDVSGTLPSTLTFDNAMALNDYFEDFTFGSTLTFQVSFYGPALSSPDGVSTSGSSFAFSLFSDGAGTIPTLTGDTTDGFAFTVDVNLDGSTSVTNYSSETEVMASTTTTVPEPQSCSLCAAAFITLIAASVRRQRRHRIH